MTARKGYSMGRKAVKGFSPKRPGTLKAMRTMKKGLSSKRGRGGY